MIYTTQPGWYFDERQFLMRSMDSRGQCAGWVAIEAWEDFLKYREYRAWRELR